MSYRENLNSINTLLDAIKERYNDALYDSYPEGFFKEFADVLQETDRRLGVIDYRYGNIVADEREGRK